jgi:CheY-like chemotaxis protein
MDNRLNILFADDDLFSRMLVDGFLKSTGYGLTFAVDGKEAVLACEIQHFDAIIMDISMPNMDGLQATKIIRQSRLPSNNADTPIIALTSLNSKSDIDHLFRVGMNYYLQKPPDFNLLKIILDDIYTWLCS